MGWVADAPGRLTDIAVDPTTGDTLAIVAILCDVLRFPEAGGAPSTLALTTSSCSEPFLAVRDDGQLALLTRTAIGPTVFAFSPSSGDEDGSYAMQRGIPLDIVGGVGGVLHVLAAPGPVDLPLPHVVTFDAARRQVERRPIDGVPSPDPNAAAWPWGLDVTARHDALVAFDDRALAVWSDRGAGRGAVAGPAGMKQPRFGIAAPFQRPNIALVGRATGGVVVLDQRGPDLYAYDADGSAERVGERPTGALDLAVAPDGAIFAAGQNMLARLAPSGWSRVCQCAADSRVAAGASGVFVTRAGRAAPEMRSVDGQRQLGILALSGAALDWPNDLVVDDQEWLWAVGVERSEVLGWRLSGEQVPDGNRPDIRMPLDSPGGALRVAFGRTAMGPRLAVIVGSANGLHARLVDPSTGITALDVPLGSLLAEDERARDVAVDGLGRLYVGLTSGRIYVLGPAAPNPDGPTATPTTVRPTPDPASACVVEGDTTVAPDRVRLGGTARVTLTLDLSCPALPRGRGADIVLAVDSSGSMSGAKLAAAQEAAKRFVQLLDRTIHRLAVVDFDSTASLVVPLTDDAEAAVQAIDLLAASGGTNIHDALAVAAEHLADQGRPRALPAIVLLTDGKSGPEGEILYQALMARIQGMLLHAIGLGEDVNADLLKLVVGSPDRYYEAPAAEDLSAIYDAIRSSIDAAARPAVTIDALAGADIAVALGSSAPPGLHSGDQVRWLAPLGDPPILRWTGAYDIVPRRVGILPVHDRAEASYVEPDDAARAFAFPQRHIDVWDDATAAAPTEPPTTASTDAPTQTATDLPTLTATPTQAPTDPPTTTPPTPTDPPTTTSTPTLRPTARPPLPLHPAYLPFAQRPPTCVARERRVDVVLVIDASTSMREPAGAGRTKLDAARAAVGSFLDAALLARGDRAAIVAFNATARVLARLTSHRPTLDAGLARIEVQQQTRLDLAIATAHGELIRAGNAANRPVIVLLTDGRINPVAPAEAVARARAAREDGIAIYAIGLGADLDLEALRDIAGAPERFFLAPTAAELDGIYRRLIEVIPCGGRTG